MATAPQKNRKQKNVPERKYPYAKMDIGVRLALGLPDELEWHHQQRSRKIAADQAKHPREKEFDIEPRLPLRVGGYYEFQKYRTRYVDGKIIRDGKIIGRC